MRYRMCTGNAVDRCTFGTYVRPLGTKGAENAWNELSLGNGIFLPEAFPHNKTVKGLHPYVRLVLPALAVTLSTLVNHPSKDPGVPMATTDGFDPSASLDHKTNFRRINGDLKRVVEEAVRAREASGSNERLDNKVKRSIAVGKHTTGKGIIGVRTRLTGCVSALHGNRVFSGQYGAISTQGLLRALEGVKHHTLGYVDDGCEFCRDRPQCLEEPWKLFKDKEGVAKAWAASRRGSTSAADPATPAWTASSFPWSSTRCRRRRGRGSPCPEEEAKEDWSAEPKGVNPWLRRKHRSYSAYMSTVARSRPPRAP